jgi:predicted Zn-dependent peptidase/outer membrane lipoprotein-sorting protein
MKGASNMNTMTRILTLVVLLLAGTAYGQIDRTKQPPAGPTPKAVFPNYDESKLPNGLKVLIVNNPSQPVVTFRLMIKSGAEMDGKKPGTAEFVTDLMTKGTATRSSLAFAKEQDFIGISVGAGAADDYMTVAAGGLKKHMNKMLELMTDAIYNPTFPQEEIDKLKKQTISGLKSEKKSPDAISSRLQITVGYGSHPYSMFQTEESVNAITRDDLVKFHKTFFMPNNASLAIVGDVTPEEVLPLIKKYFGDWQSGAFPQTSFPAIKPLKGKSVHLVDLGATQTQTEICVLTTGLKRKDDDQPVLRLANSILGGGFSGRLFQNLREKRAFTYGAYSNLDSRRMGGSWEASASVRRIATDSAITEILNEMKRMQDEVVSAEELDRHKQYFSGTFLLSLESPSTMATRLQDIDLYGLPKDYYQTYIPRIMAVTAQDLQKAAKKYWNIDNVAVLSVGDASVIKPLLEKFGTVKMYDTDMKPVEDAQPSDIDGATLLDRVIKANGDEKLGTMKDRTMEAKIRIPMGPNTMEGTLTQISALPNKLYEKMALQMGTQEKWCDGKSIVEAAGPNTHNVEGEELVKALEDAQFNDMYRAKELGFTPTAKSIKKVDGIKVYVLELAKKNSTQTLYVDASTYLVMGEDKVEKSPRGEMTIEIRYSNYKDVDGIMLPFKQSMNVGPTTIDIEVTSYKHNTSPKDDVFTKK